MTSSETMGPQFADHVRLWRGIQEENPEYVRTDNVGVHWTKSKKVAKFIATGRNAEGGEGWGDIDAPGHVLEAMVPKSSINEDAGEDYDLGSSAEKEVPLLYNAPITLIGIHPVSGDQKLTKKPIPPMETRT